jgi:YidC/Oxa1 family membrane protein insertase
VEKRLFLFMLLSTSVLVGFSLLNAWLIGPQERDARPQPDEDAVAQRPVEEVEGAAEPRELDPAAVTPDAVAPAEEESAAAEPRSAPVREIAEHAPAWITLGSYDPASSSKLLVVLNNQGAAVEKIEIVERNRQGRFRFRNIENPSGYLGYLALSDVREGGCRIQVVPPGSPAAGAEPRERDLEIGLRPGDIVVGLNERDVRSREGFYSALQRTRPGQHVTLKILRGDGDIPLEFTAILSERPFDLLGPETDERNGPGPNPGSFRVGLGAAFVHDARDLVLDPGLMERHWEIREATEKMVEFRLMAPVSGGGGEFEEGPLEYVKRYRLAGGEQADADGKPSLPGYHFELDVEVHNRGDQPRRLAYQLEGPNGLSTEGWWFSTKIHPSFFKAAGARDVIWNAIGTGHQLRGAGEIFKQATSKQPERPLFSATAAGTSRELRYIGVDSQYFAVAMMAAGHVFPPSAENSPGNSLPADETTMMIDEVVPLAVGDLAGLSGGRTRLTNVSYVMTSNIREIAPEGSLKSQYLIFAGPKDADVLYEYRLSDILYFGWFPWVAKPLARILHFFYGLVGNYGLAIIMLTVLVRGCMFPLSRKAAKNAAMMQQLAPEIKRISEKYKNDMDKRVKAQRELYSKYNFNPFSGCLLVFLQLPIFIGLYRSLSVDIELRQAPLIPGIQWASNLAGPDKLWRWPLPDFLAAETGFLGPYLNILPVVTVALFLVQQKLFTPPAVDEQTRMQQQMMKYMMVFIGVLFFKVPAGLCIYFISSSLWGIAERLMLPKVAPPGSVAAAVHGGTPGGDSKRDDARGRKRPPRRPKKR